MSDETERRGLRSVSSEAALERVADWYPVPVLGVLVAFMFWVRMQRFDRFTRGGEVYFRGNDAWYHLRQVRYTVENWPAVMPFDPWTNFSYGTSVGQFGTLYDQLVATAALIVGLGDPSARTVALTLLVSPAVIGALTVIPTYFIGKRLSNRLGGVFGAVVLALLPGIFLFRGLVGAADHHIVEVLFQATAMLATMVALGVAERDRPVWEQVHDRDVAALRPTLGWSVLAGVAAALYIWVWPPGVLLFGILGVFYVVQLSADYARGASPEHVAFVGAISMTVAGLLSLVPFASVGFSATQFSLLQPLLAFVVAAGTVFMAWLAREWDARDLSTPAYPATIAAIIVAAVALVAVAFPDLFSLLSGNLRRIVGFGTTSRTATIQEAQPWLADAQLFPAAFAQYGLTFFAAVLGAIVMAVRTAISDDRRAERLLVLVWFVFVLSAAFTQVRFNYYLAVGVAVMNAYLFGLLVDWVGIVDPDDRGLEAYQLLTIGAAIVLLLSPMAVGVQSGSARVTTPVQAGQSNGPGGSVMVWEEGMEWMQLNTPAEGDYGGADNADVLDTYGTYDRVANFDYPAGAYGVLSWWDYGHWMTLHGDRIPVANPFQENADTAANFLLAGNESQAADVLNDLDEDDAKTRYVAIDWQMVTPGSKFGAPVQFYDRGELRTEQFRQAMYIERNGTRRFAQWLRFQPYYDSMMARLYLYHGSAATPEPVVTDWSQSAYSPGLGENVTIAGEQALGAKRFDNVSAAREFLANDPGGTSQLGGVGPYPTEYVPALERYRLVKAEQPLSTQRAFQLGLIQNTPAWLKLFERVEGATIEGQGPANETVEARVQMRVPSIGSTFVYQQRAETGADGSFTMTVPYSTTGYEEWGPNDGYTNVSVRATGPYHVTTDLTGEDGGPVWNGSVEVTEGQVIGEVSDPATVTLEEVESGTENGSGNGTASVAHPGTVPTRTD